MTSLEVYELYKSYVWCVCFTKKGGKAREGVARKASGCHASENGFWHLFFFSVFHAHPDHDENGIVLLRAALDRRHRSPWGNGKRFLLHVCRRARTTNR